mmetsp:Transcript_22962/g.66465  ORF Transcript_22962/g.66465 Transcript_22962/m.66465 type:complete len:265 (-) Transcript_22962:384-1178(-)
MAQVHPAAIALLPTLDLIFPVQAADQLLSALLDAVIDMVFLEVAIYLIFVARHVGHAGAAPRTFSHPLVGHDHLGSGPRCFYFVEHLSDELLTHRVHTLRDLQLLGPDVIFILEGEATADQAIFDDAHRPHVDLRPIVPIEKLRRPKDLRAHPFAQAVLPAKSACSAEVSQHDFALRVRHVLPVHQIVVALHIPVNDAPGMQVFDAGAHLARNMYDVMAVDLPPLLKMSLESLHQVAARVLVHDDANKAPLVKDAMHLHDVWVV